MDYKPPATWKAALAEGALYIAAIILAALVMATAADAQNMMCGQRDVMTKKLGDKYGEAQTGYGTTGQRVIEHWANPETGSWTILMSLPDGKSCVVATGQNWSATAYVEPVKGDPT